MWLKPFCSKSKYCSKRTKCARESINNYKPGPKIYNKLILVAFIIYFYRIPKPQEKIYHCSTSKICSSLKLYLHVVANTCSKVQY